MSFTTTIKRKYFEMKMFDINNMGYFEEYKDMNQFWITRYQNLKIPCDAVFLVGSEVHRFQVVDKKIINHYDVPYKYHEAISTPQSIVFRISKKPNREKSELIK